MTTSKLFTKVKKTIAVLSSLALLMSCGLFEALSASAADNSGGHVGEVYVYDEFGNDISEEPIIYVDNQSIAGQPTEATVTIHMTDSVELNDGFVIVNESDKNADGTKFDIVRTTYTKPYGPGSKEMEMKITVKGCKENWTQVKNPLTDLNEYRKVESPYKPGESSFFVYSPNNHDKFRRVRVIVQEPASDITITYSNGKTADVNDYNFSNVFGGANGGFGRIVTFTEGIYNFKSKIVTNHQQDYDSNKISHEYFDTVQWAVFERDPSTGKPLIDETTGLPVPTDKADISPDGILTCHYSGDVSVVAFFAPTKGYKHRMEMAQKALESNLITADEVPVYPINIYSNEPTDRLTTVGKKKRKIYVPEYDKDDPKNILLEGTAKNFWVKWDTEKDSSGNATAYKTKEVDTTYEAIREHYYIANDILYGEPEMKTGYNSEGYLIGYPVGYKDINTMPKFLPVDIVLRNPATSVTITGGPHYIDLTDGPQALKYTMTPTFTGNGYESGATDVLEWKSSDEKIAKVDSSGLVTPVSKGTVQITALAEGYDKDGKRITSNEYTITVYSKAETIQVVPNSISTRVGVFTEISAVEGPTEKAPNDDVEWVSEDESIATVIKGEYSDSNVQTAQVWGVSEGQTYIYAKATRSGGVRSARCLVKVGARNASKDIKMTISHDSSEGTEEIVNGSTTELFTTHDITINASPLALINNEWGSADDTIEWSVLNNGDDPNKPLYATIISKDSRKIVLHGMAEGEFTVMATCASTANTEEVISNIVKVKVLKECDQVAITDLEGTTKYARNLPLGCETSLIADMTIYGNYPYEHSDYIKEWKSSNPAVLSVDVEEIPDEDYPDDLSMVKKVAKLKALKDGDATIYAVTASGKSANTGKMVVFTTSAVSLTGIDIETDGSLTASIQMDKTLVGTKQLGVTVRDQNNKTVTGSQCDWTSSDESIATVSSTGLVTALDVGETTITVTSGSKTESCKVTVFAPMEAVMYSEIEPYLYSPWMSVYEPHPIFTIGTHTLAENINYTTAYTNNTKVGKATMTLTGSGYYTGTKTLNFQINKRPLTDDSISVEYIENQECTGQAIKPELTITCLGSALEETADYKVTYSNNTKPGTATMKITGVNNYSETIEKEFEITCSHLTLKNSTILQRPTYEETGLEVGTCAACGEKDIQKVIPVLEHTSNPATSISFTQEAYGLETGETLQLELNAETPNPGSPATDVFRWESDNPNIVSVDDTGLVKGVKKGVATITAYGENEDAVATCEVGVLTKAKSITVNPSPAATRLDIAIELKAELDPTNSEDDIVWTSANESIATVAASPNNKYSAIVTGVSLGTTTITAKAKYSNVSTDIEVSVGERNPSDVIAISTIIDNTPTLIPNSTEESVYTQKIFSTTDVEFNSVLTDKFGNPSDDTTVWQITDNENDTVTIPDTEPGKDIVADSITIHAASLGTVTVIAYPQTKPELKTTFKVEVVKRSNNIVIMDQYDNKVSTKSLNVDDTLPLHTELTINDPNHPYDHGDEVFSWTSSDPEVAEVSELGVVTAKKNGKATITMTTLSEQKATVNLTVFTTSSVYLTSGVTKPENEGDMPTTEIALNNKFIGTKKIGTTVYDQDEKSVSNVTCKWTSSDEKVATVTETGEIIGNDVGEAIITVTSGAKSESLKLKITATIGAIAYQPNPIEDMIWSPLATEYTPEPTIKIGKLSENEEDPYEFMYELVKDQDYTAEYLNNTKVGKASIKLTGIGNYTGTMTIPYNIVKRDLTDPTVLISQIPEQTWTGKPVTPEVVISCLGIPLEDKNDFTVKYENNTDEGTAKAIITATSKSNYTGSAIVEFSISKNVRGKIGDIDGDNSVTANDALLVLRSSVGMGTLDFNASGLADVNGDNNVDSSDALEILRYSVGLAATTSKVGKDA